MLRAHIVHARSQGIRYPRQDALFRLANGKQQLNRRGIEFVDFRKVEFDLWMGLSGLLHLFAQCPDLEYRQITSRLEGHTWVPFKRYTLPRVTLYQSVL